MDLEVKKKLEVKRNYVPVNLQLFAEGPEDDELLDDDIDEDIEDEEVQEDEADAEEEEGTDENEAAEEEEEETAEEPVKPKQDKKTHAIIKAKQKAKAKEEENRQLKAELERYRQAAQAREDEKRRKDLEQKYVAEGWHEEYAKKLAAQDLKLEQLERRQIRGTYERQAEKLESKYPDVWNKLGEFIEICEKTGWSLDKVCRAELEEYDPVNAKIKDEQAEVLRRKSTVQKKPVTSGGSKLETIKLSAEDEAAYKTYAKYNPGVSRKQYKERVLDPRNKQYED